MAGQRCEVGGVEPTLSLSPGVCGGRGLGRVECMGESVS